MSQSIPRPTAAFPLIVRLLIDLFQAGELPHVAELDVEPQYGYVARVVYHGGAVRLLRGTNTDANGLGAAEIARDKGYTKFFLQRLGYQVPRGETFLFPHYVDQIHRNVGRYAAPEYRRVEDAPAYVVDALRYPCYVKPNNGSQGRGVSRVKDEGELRAVIQHLEELRTNAVVVEEEVALPDCRVVVWREELVACYLRVPLQITGDGAATVRELLVREQVRQMALGRDTVIHLDDPRIVRRLRSAGWDLHTVLPAGHLYQVYDISNLSAGGEARDCTEALHPHWRELCVRLTREMGLQLCGVDLACADLTQPEAAYSILEINPAPGMDHYAAMGPRQMAIVRDFYRRLFSDPG